MVNRKITKISKEDVILDSINYFVLSIILVSTLYPFYYVLIISFNEGIDASRGGIYFWPRTPSLENYRLIFSESKWLNAFKISVLRTILGTVSGLFFTAMVAYGLSHKELLFKRFYFVAIIFTMYFSGGIIPYYVLLKSLGLLDNFWVYVIPMMLNPFFAMVMVSFFREMPNVLKESAKIDGANDLRIFFSLILPLSKPVLATIALFTSVLHWNSWLDAAYFIQTPKLKTMSYYMMEIINKSMTFNMKGSSAGASAQEALGMATSITTKSIQMATIVVAVTPILLVYPFLQRYFIKGMMIGAVKG